MFLLRFRCVPQIILLVLSSVSLVLGVQSLELKNQHMVAKFGPSGLISLQQGKSSPRAIVSDSFSFEVDSESVEELSGKAEVTRSGADEISYRFRETGYTVDVVYRIEPTWNFVTKRVQLTSTPHAQFMVRRINPVNLSFSDRIDSVFIPGTYLPQYRAPLSGSAQPTKDFGAFVRFADKSGIMVVVQNPFLHVDRRQRGISIEYSPEMAWNNSWGPFASDLACIGAYTVTGHRSPSRMTNEWELRSSTVAADGADGAEVDAFTNCVRAFLMHPSQGPISVEVGWTLNDYQIDVATRKGRAEYKRVIDTTSALGIQTLVYTPENSGLADREQDADAWGAEHLLWLGLGQKLREGKWNPETGQIPPSVSEMVDYASAKHVGLLAYVYPSLPFVQDSTWLVKTPNRTNKNVSATLASRQFQDFLLKQLVAFEKRTKIVGYSFDYAILNLPGSSAYAQWRGWCRVLKGLREAIPNIVIDGRQTYQNYGPWSWLAGSYPHPTGTDEQPESFVPFPDLHFDRVSADRMRFVNYWYRNFEFAPEEIIPGYMTHQTERYINVPQNGSSGVVSNAQILYTPYRQRDWDYLGYKYSVISSIATGGWNNVMDMIPGRDPQEFKLFSKSPDELWIRHWLDWTSLNKKYLRRTRNILGVPAMGKIDGTSAILGDRGYIFLFNPNYKRLAAEFQLNSSIGLEQGKAFMIREIYPQEGRNIGKPGVGLWRYGDQFHLALDGTSATVLQIEPALDRVKNPIVFDSPDANGEAKLTAVLKHGVVRIEHVSGEPGASQSIGILLPEGTAVRRMTVNGRFVSFNKNNGYVSSNIRFAGLRFAHSQQVKVTGGADGLLTGSFVVPERIFKRLAVTQRAWPVHWDPEDYNTTWLVPSRLLMFIQFAEPKDTMKVSMMLDGAPLPLNRAYSSVRVHAPSFVGFYVDLSDVKPDTTHTIALRFPQAARGRFQGVFFDNVEPEFTEQLSR